ncbi:hypothetical protein OFO10_03685 [Campylobacter sp. VBCF_06 NA8]|uniref:hypothetical protein n=1 Tax=Campylobacter sp. VBCF_06 NA8 TaxID=2983822 RepID=UPI0022E9C4A8|nr:hypothetical protein [Campylobacter sp. VBCF_06 NA8]MDA3046250.1 hypothetical protein [Campylobacter sp. VBCF_06 NA8]
MIVLWIIALLLAIPTYGISIIVALVITFFISTNDDISAQSQRDNYYVDKEIDYMSRQIAQAYRGFLKKPSRFSDMEIADLILEYQAKMIQKIHNIGLPQKEIELLLSVQSTYIVSNFYENYDYFKAQQLAEKYLRDWYIDLRNKGYQIS